MNRRILAIIIFLMGFVLVVLLFIQVYWIRNSLMLREANFTSGVEEAVSNVVLSLERMESGKRLRSFKESARLYRKIDSLNYLINKRYQELTGENTDASLQSRAKPKSAQEKKSWRTLRDLDTSLVIQENNSIQEETDSLNNQKLSRDQNIKPKVVNIEEDPKYKRLQKQRERVVEELMSRSLIYDAALGRFDEIIEMPLEKRIQPVIIDSMLSIELENKGIRTEYEFGIYDTKRDSLIFQKTGMFTQELLNKGFAVNLFPRQPSKDKAILLLYFPYERRYMLKQIWWLLLLSIILVGTFIAIFYKTISTILYQKKLSDMKNDFISNITHEFKTPVSTISIACEALTDSDIVKTPAVAANYIQIIADENKRLGTMAEKILMASVLEEGKLQLKLAPCSMHEIISDCVQKVTLQAKNAGGSIQTQFDALHDLVHGDKLHLTSVVINLLDNAIKYSPIKPTIKIKTYNHQQNFVFEVMDNGIGISKENQGMIFDKLYRVPTGNIHNVKGFGLGLSYTKAIVEAHKGSISVSSELKKGTTFTVVLPYFEP